MGQPVREARTAKALGARRSGARVKVALAWGCGIGSVLALDALRGHDVTLVHVGAPESSDAHVPPFVVEAQAAALGLPLVLAPAGGTQLGSLAQAVAGLRPEKVAFGYLRGEEYEQYHLAKALDRVKARALLPVRHLPPGEAARHALDAGHRAFVRAVAPPFDASLLGRSLEPPVVDDIDARAGRRGWAAVRALAVGGPRFRRPAHVAAGEPRPAGDGWRLDVSPMGC